MGIGTCFGVEAFSLSKKSFHEVAIGRDDGFWYTRLGGARVGGLLGLLSDRVRIGKVSLISFFSSSLSLPLECVSVQ